MKTLVIGYGNALRSDDGVGPLVADRVAYWNLPDVRSLSVHQLAPELATEIAQAEIVFFVDACVERSQASLEPIEAEEATSRLDHLWSPSVLLYLAKTLYDADPVAYEILIPATQFEYGETLSAITCEGADWAIAKLAAVLRPNSVRIGETQIAANLIESTFHQSRTAAIRSPPERSSIDKTSSPHHW
ncbi:MAG: hydrogenase maturation protease [Thermosynechococcaceae cyanobacterium]